MTDEQIEIDVADLDAMFSRIPSAPYSADARGESWEVRAIDTDPTNDHHWPYRLCESIRGQKAGCDPDVFGFIAGVINAWPSIRAALSARLADAVQPAAGEGGLTVAAAMSDLAEQVRALQESLTEMTENRDTLGDELDSLQRRYGETLSQLDDLQATNAAEIERAALSTSVPAGVVGIKPLAWDETLVDRGDGSSDVDGWEAETAFGACYGIEIDFGTDSYIFRLTFDGILIDCFEDENAAKGFAQTHFAARIRSCLLTPPAQEPTR